MVPLKIILVNFLVLYLATGKEYVCASLKKSYHGWIKIIFQIHERCIFSAACGAQGDTCLILTPCRVSVLFSGGDKNNLQCRTTESAYYRAHSCGGCQLTKLTEFGYIKYNVLGYSRVINWAFSRPAWNNQTTVLTANAWSLNQRVDYLQLQVYIHLVHVRIRNCGIIAQHHLNSKTYTQYNTIPQHY